MSRRALATATGAAGVALLLAAAVAAAPATVSLTADGGPRLVEGKTTLTTLAGYGIRGTDVLGYADGAAITLAVPVRNTGALPVTVTSVSLSDAVLPLVDLDRVPGLPLTVAPGRTRTLTLRATLRHCAYYHEREVQLYDALRLGTRVLGLPGDTVVALPRPVLVHAPMIVGCPDRKLDRQARDRSDVVDAA